MTNCIIVDIDGTLANTDHRKHFLEQKPKNWRSWHAAADGDTPHSDVMDVVGDFSCARNVPVVLCSGRNEAQRSQTVGWMRRNHFPFKALYMRADGDYRPDHIIKRELLARIRADGFEPFCVFEDRDSVVAMWREEGLRCFQVAPGDF
jgi:hypothetical protein